MIKLKILDFFLFSLRILNFISALKVFWFALETYSIRLFIANLISDLIYACNDNTLIRLSVWKSHDFTRKYCLPALYVIIVSLFSSINIKLLAQIYNNIKLLIIKLLTLYSILLLIQKISILLFILDFSILLFIFKL